MVLCVGGRVAFYVRKNVLYMSSAAMYIIIQVKKDFKLSSIYFSIRCKNRGNNNIYLGWKLEHMLSVGGKWVYHKYTHTKSTVSGVTQQRKTFMSFKTRPARDGYFHIKAKWFGWKIYETISRDYNPQNIKCYSFENADHLNRKNSHVNQWRSFRLFEN